jgi:tetratricopeptide (TPR) repeat protein
MLVSLLVAAIVILGLVVVYIYQIAPRLNPKNRAESYMKSGMVDEAVIEYRRILDSDYGDFSAHYKLADIYLGRDEIDEAAIHYEEVLSIGKYNFEVDKLSVQKKLAGIYLTRDELERVFQTCLDIIRQHPSDSFALYHGAFISLGQELFEMSSRFFEPLARGGKKDFRIQFGAGISFFQSQKTNEATAYFKEALSINPHSDIGNLAMAFAQQRKRDYRTGINYAKMVVENSSDQTALFIAKRLLSILHIQAKRAVEGVKILQELLGIIQNNEMNDEKSMILYDLGFACLRAEHMSEQAYQYWNELYQHDRNYKNIQKLTTMLRKEMDYDMRAGGGNFEGSVLDLSDAWIESAFPENFIWNICGLKSDKKLDLKQITVTTRVGGGGAVFSDDSAYDAMERVNEFEKIDNEKFRIIANRMLGKLGYRVDEILQTYREQDGVDFMAYSIAEKERTLVWVRRWKDTKVSDIPLRNFAQAINDSKSKQGVFMTTTEITPSGEDALKRLSKVKLIGPIELGKLLADFI